MFWISESLKKRWYIIINQQFTKWNKTKFWWYYLKILFTILCIGTLRKKISYTRASSIIDYQYQRILDTRNGAMTNSWKTNSWKTNSWNTNSWNTNSWKDKLLKYKLLTRQTPDKTNSWHDKLLKLLKYKLLKISFYAELNFSKCIRIYI